jgi:hypothetical protein
MVMTKILYLCFVFSSYSSMRQKTKKSHEERYNFHFSPIIRAIKSKRIKSAGHVIRMVEMRNAYKILVGTPEGKIPLKRPRSKWEETVCKGS